MNLNKKLVAGISAVLLTFAACSAPPLETSENSNETTETTSETNENQTTGEPITIGAIGPLTGDGSAYGQPMQRAIEYAKEELNKAGGIKGRPLEVIWGDGKCNGKDAATEATKLINVDKVKVIIGGFCSGETLGIAPIAEAAKVILISPASSSPEITNSGDFIFRVWPSDLSQAKLIAEKANEMNFTKVGFISEQSDYAIGLLEAFKANFNGEVMAETYLSTDSDFKTQITKLKSEAVDAVFINPQTPNKGDLIFKQMQELAFKPTQIFTNEVVATSADVLTKYAEFLEGTIGADVQIDTSKEGFMKMAKYHQEKYGEEVAYTSYSAGSYDALNVITEALSTVGEENSEAIRDYLYSIKNREGLLGSLTIDKNGDPTSGHVLKVIKAGQAELL